MDNFIKRFEGQLKRLFKLKPKGRSKINRCLFLLITKNTIQNQKNIIKDKGDFIMANYKFQKCGKIWHGWAQSDIYLDCSGKLEKVKEEKNK